MNVRVKIFFVKKSEISSVKFLFYNRCQTITFVGLPVQFARPNPITSDVNNIFLILLLLIN